MLGIAGDCWKAGLPRDVLPWCDVYLICSGITTLFVQSSGEDLERRKGDPKMSLVTSFNGTNGANFGQKRKIKSNLEDRDTDERIVLILTAG